MTAVTKGLLKVRIITPDRIAFEGEAGSLRYPAEDGLVGVLPGHAPMITTVETGILRMTLKSGGDFEMVVSRGFCEVRDDEVHLVVDSGETPDGIDVRRAEEALARARRRLKERSPGLDLARAEYALRRALLRTKAGKRR